MALETKLVKYGRVSLLGAAVVRSNGHVKALTNMQVLAKCGCAPVHVEMRIRRVTWLQAMMRDPWSHRQCLAAVFGSDKGEELDLSNPWAKQWAGDVEALRVVDDGMALWEANDMNLK
eukprot:6837531-Prorocentrum_lima.AAC.1